NLFQKKKKTQVILKAKPPQNIYKFLCSFAFNEFAPPPPPPISNSLYCKDLQKHLPAFSGLFAYFINIFSKIQTAPQEQPCQNRAPTFGEDNKNGDNANQCIGGWIER
ncbi:MAG: hypothetical protein LBC87_12535, partial [Fibromonadaceae bacterium]|nr:hypothetical protein [Fibromonadaceae bacterium]